MLFPGRPSLEASLGDMAAGSNRFKVNLVLRASDEWPNSWQRHG